MNKIIDESYTTLEDLLGYYYDCPNDFTDVDLFKHTDWILEKNHLGLKNIRIKYHPIAIYVIIIHHQNLPICDLTAL
jgi:hypothetical protein